MLSKTGMVDFQWDLGGWLTHGKLPIVAEVCYDLQTWQDNTVEAYHREICICLKFNIKLPDDIICCFLLLEVYMPCMYLAQCPEMPP